MKVASDKCSVKKVLLVVDRGGKVMCFYIDQHLLSKSVAGYSFLKNNLRHIFLVLNFFG